MLRRPSFWIAFVAISITAAIFTVRNFSKAFPLVSVDFKMDREDALASARDLAAQQNWPPAGFEQAVAFQSSPEVQSFIELEGGGKPELARILEQHVFSPYTWEVRHYREGDAHETRIRFTPEGQPYGFRVKLPEQEAGASLERSPARLIAENAATQQWNVDLSRYALVEPSQKAQTGGRRDHTFVYERQDIRVGEGKYRLRLVVGGDRLTELTYFVEVPEAFNRRYQEMRSANDLISTFDTAALFVVYLLGFCGVGLFLLMRKRWVIWRPPLIWSLVISILVGSDLFNSWPRMWMDYDTALPASGFMVQRVIIGLLSVGFMAILLVISLMAAESLSRRAFPHQVQLWRLWSPPVASSTGVLGQISGGYLLVSVFFAYEVVLYAFAQTRLGWWSPSDSLINPDLFGTYVPALSAVANSLQAGFWEECLFRAVPLAAAALIGERFGGRKILIAVAMVVQALVFASGHAGYVNQPAYSRVVELIIPSFAFGFLYLAFGLLPGIILHYTFDLVWFSLPIFLSSGPRAHVEQVLVVLLAFVPLGVCLIARGRTGRWTELAGDYFNRAWFPPENEPREPAFAVERETLVLSPIVLRVLPVAGVLALVAWLGLTTFKSEAPALNLSRSQAEQSARQALMGQGVQLDASWKVLSRTETQPGEQHQFVWKTAGRETFDRLLGTYLAVPHWLVRFARFEGDDVAARAEEYQVLIADHPNTLRIRHQLAEATPGKSLTEDEARVIAKSAAQASGRVPVEHLREISAEAKVRPMRSDWTFQFSDTREQGLGEGQARIAVNIASDQVVDVTPYVYVPEQWARNERARHVVPDILNIVSIILVVGSVLAGVALAVVRWSRHQGFSVRSGVTFFAVMLVLGLAGLINNWPVTKSNFPTDQPFLVLTSIVIVLGLVLAILLATAFGLMGGAVMGGVSQKSAVSFRQAVLLGLSLGMVVVALMEAGKSGDASGPQWVGFQSVAELFPLIAGVVMPVNRFLTGALVLSILLQLARMAYSRVAGNRIIPILVLVLVGLIGSGVQDKESVMSWLITGLSAGIVLAASHFFLLRHSFAVLPVAVATVLAIETLISGMSQSHPAALPGAVVGAVLVLVFGLVWARASVVDEIPPASV